MARRVGILQGSRREHDGREPQGKAAMSRGKHVAVQGSVTLKAGDAASGEEGGGRPGDAPP